MNINELAKEVHENAVNHGWWEKPPSLPEALCLIHAELSEALEEYRNGSPLVYGTCALSPDDCDFALTCEIISSLGPMPRAAVSTRTPPPAGNWPR